MDPKLPPENQAEIIYEQVGKKTVELGTHFMIKATVKLLDPKLAGAKFCVEPSPHWAIIGRSRASLKENVTEVKLQGMPTVYGRIQIPTVRIESMNEVPVKVKESGNTQTVTVKPRAIVGAVPKVIN